MQRVPCAGVFLAGMLRAFARLGKVAVGGFQHGVLIAMAQLTLHGSIAFLSFFFCFKSTFKPILIFSMIHL